MQMVKRRRNKRARTEWKIGMKMKVWKNKELVTNDVQKETVKKQSLDRP
jgi:hypothetical protein